MTGTLEKAKFEIYENVDSATPKETIAVLFNPSQYSISGGATYGSHNRSGKKNSNNNSSSSEKNNFLDSRLQTLSLELFLDTSGKTLLGKKPEDAIDVSVHVKKFMDMVRVKGEIHTPLIVRFCWGSLKFRGRVDDVNTTYTMFTSEGKPIRAKVTLKITEVRKLSEKYMEPFESPDRTKARMITQGTTVWSIAQAEYGTPAMWREICQANQIPNPLEIPVGTVLKVPALE